MKVKIIDKREPETALLTLTEIAAYRWIVYIGCSPYLLHERRSGKWVWLCMKDFHCFANSEHATKELAIGSYRTCELHVFENANETFKFLYDVIVIVGARSSGATV